MSAFPLPSLRYTLGNILDAIIIFFFKYSIFVQNSYRDPKNLKFRLNKKSNNFQLVYIWCFIEVYILSFFFLFFTYIHFTLNNILLCLSQIYSHYNSNLGPLRSLYPYEILTTQTKLY